MPIVAAIGNHEYNSKFFWNYFYNGKNDDDPKYFDQLTSRFITLSSTFGRRKKSQLEWLNLTLNNAKDNGMKFIFLQYHHPAYSEVWRRRKSLLKKNRTDSKEVRGRLSRAYYHYQRRHSRLLKGIMQTVI